MEKDPFIEHIKQFVDLTGQEIELLSRHTNSRKYLKGQYLVQQGDISKHENFVVKGCIKIYHIDHEGNEHIITFAVENWWAGDLGSFLTGNPADYNVQCIENSEVIQFSFEDFQFLIENIPAFERFSRIITERAYVAAQKRIIRNFSVPAKDRYLNFQKQYPDIEQRVPQYMIASYLGITKEFLSKIRSQIISEH